MATISRHGKGWRVQIRRKGFEPLSETFPLKKQAEAWGAQREAEIVQGRLGILPQHTLGEALKEYREKRARNRWERNRLLVLERDRIAKVGLQALDSSHLSDLRDRELARGIEGTTVRRQMSLLASVFKACREWRWLSHNPFQDFERPAPKKGRARGVRQAEIDAVVAALGWTEEKPKTFAQQVAVAFLLAVETGMRAGEILSLTWDQVFEKRVHLEKTKNGDERDVPLSARARELLSLMRGIDENRVFTVSEPTRDALFREARKSAQLSGFTFHDSRSEAISRLSKKLDIRELARMVGHRDLNSLMIYYRDRPEDIADRL
jgi:integrase